MVKGKNKFKAAIFDMDGLLIDSMLYWIEVDNKFFNKYNIKLTEKIIIRLTGKSEIENMIWLKNEFGLPGTVEELLEERQESTDNIYTEKTMLMPGVDQLLTKIKQKRMLQSIASGAPLHHINIAANRFNWYEYFDELISTDQVNHTGKPDPGVYLHVAKITKVKPEECVVFEDAENGIVSAKRAGMKCIAVPDKRWSFGDLSRADLTVESLEDVRILEYLNL